MVIVDHEGMPVPQPAMMVGWVSSNCTVVTWPRALVAVCRSPRRWLPSGASRILGADFGGTQCLVFIWWVVGTPKFVDFYEKNLWVSCFSL